MENLPIQEIKKTFNSFVSLDDQELGLILQKAKLLQVPKRTRLLEMNAICDKMYFVIKGCLRLYYIKDGVERNGFFFHENLFCTAFGSFMMQRPSNQILETMEDSICLYTTYNELQELYEVFPKMNIIVRKIVEERYTNAHDIISSFILHCPEERYLEFIDKYPLLVNRIPEYHIASYLGITAKSFSRLKKRVHEKMKEKILKK